MSDDALVPSEHDELAEPDGAIQQPTETGDIEPPHEAHVPVHDVPRGEDEENIVWEADARQRKPSVYPTKGRLVVEGGSLVFIQPKRVLDISSFVITGLEVEEPPVLNRYVLMGLVKSILGGIVYILAPLLGGALVSFFPGLIPVLSVLLLGAGILAISYGVLARKPRVVARTADTTYRFDLDEGDTPEKLIPILRNN